MNNVVSGSLLGTTGGVARGTTRPSAVISVTVSPSGSMPFGIVHFSAGLPPISTLRCCDEPQLQEPVEDRRRWRELRCRRALAGRTACRGHFPIMLLTQLRCHLATVSNPRWATS